MPNFLRSISQCRLTRLLFILSIAVFVIISLWHLRVSRQSEQELTISGHNMELPTRVERLVDEGSPIPAYPSHHDGWDAASSPAPRAMSDRLERVQRYCGTERPSLPISVADIPANSTNLSWCSVSSPASAQWTSIMTQPSYNGRCQGSNSFQNCHVLDRDNQTQGRSYSFLITGHPFERIVSVYHMLFEVMCKQHAEICHRNFIQFGRQILYDQRDPHHHTDQEKRALLSSAADFIQSGLSELHYDRNNPYHNPPFPTFNEFSAAILSGGLSDELWEPLFTLCSPCSFHYLAVVDLATFSRDTHYIIQTLGLPPQSIVGDTPPSALAWEPVFLSLPSDLQRRYKEFYLADCQLLGYDCGVAPAAPPPSSQGVVPTHHELAGSKTPYSRVGGHIDQHNFPCEPSAIFSIHRHGIRDAASKAGFKTRIKNLMSKIKDIHSRSSSELPDWILDVEYRFTTSTDLTRKGYAEPIRQGKRYRAAFPGLLSDPSSIQVSSSSKARCVSSAIALLYGMLGNTYSTPNATAIMGGDVSASVRGVSVAECQGEESNKLLCRIYQPLLTPSRDSVPLKMFNPGRHALIKYYQRCEGCVKATNLLLENESGVPAYISRSRQLTQALNDMSGRLGYSLTLDEMSTMHLFCITEQTLPNLVNNGNFCSFFKPEELEILSFYKDMLVHETMVTKKRIASSCILMQEAIRSLRNNEKSFLFGHSQTLLPFFEYLGIVSEPLDHWIDDIMARRFFGDMMPYSGILTFVAMDGCQGVDNGSRVVQTFLNEKLVEIPDCNSPCTLDKLEELFPQHECDYFNKNSQS